MAVFGLQIVLSLIVFYFLTKLTKYYSLGRWLLCTGLFRYWPPTNDEFKTAIKQRYAKESTNSNKSKKQNISKSFHKSSSSSTNNHETSSTLEEFPIPPDTSIELKLIPLMQRDVLQVKYVDEFIFLVDFIAGTIVIFLLTELYLWLMPIIRAKYHSEPVHEFNLSLLWCTVSFLLLLSILTKFVREYLKVDEGILCIVFGALSFLLAMCLQYVDEHLLHLNLKETYGNRTLSIHDDDEEINYFDRRFIYIVMLFALINAYQSMILFFPAFRFGQLQHQFLIKFDKQQQQQTKKQIAIHLLTILNFILPILSCLLWLQPIVIRLNNEYYLVHARIVSILLCIVLRIVLFKPYIQMYLDTAFDRVKVLYDQQQQQSTTNSPRITNLSYQRNVTSIFLYVGVVASQYLLPTLMELLLCFYLKVFSSHHPSTNFIQQQPPFWLKQLDIYLNSNSNSSLLASWHEMRTIVNNQQISVLLSYFLFWHHTIFCLISCGSLIYNTYMQRELRSG